MATPDAFLLLTLPNATLTVSGTKSSPSQSGILSLECVTVQIPNATAATDRDVYLVLRLNAIETAIDPARVIQRTENGGRRMYTFHPTDTDPSELVVSIPLMNGNAHVLEDLETFESILAQYADLRGAPGLSSPSPTGAPAPPGTSRGFPGAHGDLRGQLVMVNEDTGEVLGQFDNAQFRVQEDPSMHEKGRENDAVIIEVPERRSGEEQDATAMEMFIRAVPPEQQDWITKSATIVSHAISQTTNLLLTTITTASSYYIAHSTPSPHHSSSSTPSSSTPSSGTPKSTPGTPKPPPPPALVFLTSERTRKGLAGVHAVSGQAVKVSSKTVSAIDSMIRRAMGGKAKRQKFTTRSGVSSPASLSPAASSSGSGSPTPPRLPLRSPSSSSLAPPAYVSIPGKSSSFPNDTKPALPPRRSPSPVPPTLPRRSPTHTPQAPEIQAPRPAVTLSKKERILLSADLIFATIDNETRRVLDTGTERIGAVVGHKYGEEAKETSLLMAGTARNVGLVYVDMRGIGRRALLKQAGMQLVRGRVSENPALEGRKGEK
ncbi:hypothetical protein Hypma_008599 [Hypsizygus marmoreus]|uniref:Senescence domain-containing protein n=1 Tax=Hypsizygus marmoreus TaxID=39966 RepID=A0A369JXT8_HYPMA|nr:hypothetical protein Hypma_008599 [Hypsizygus marmoreus]